MEDAIISASAMQFRPLRGAAAAFNLSASAKPIVESVPNLVGRLQPARDFSPAGLVAD
jgi:hypothetical protein